MTVVDMIAEADPKGILHLDVSSPVKAGRVSVRIEMEPCSGAPAARTAADMLESSLRGLWRDRQDVAGSAEFAARLRRQGESRARG